MVLGIVSRKANLAAQGIETGLVDRVTERTFDIAVDCTGNPSGFDSPVVLCVLEAH